MGSTARRVRTRGGAFWGAVLGLAGLTLSAPYLARGQEAPARDPFRALEDPSAPAEGRRPALALRGLLQLRGRVAGALLQVGEQVHVVRAGQTLQATPGQPRARLEVVGVVEGALVLRWEGDASPLSLR